jgi:hypothetical protein
MDYDATKQAVLAHIDAIFKEMEEGMALSHQEKYALLEDAFQNATDLDELRVAFDQWYADHADDIAFDLESDELWDQAIAVAEE